MWPFDPVTTLPTLVNRVLVTLPKDLQTALNIATSENDPVGINCYQHLIDLQAFLLSKLGLKEGDTVGVAAMNEILHALATDDVLQTKITDFVNIALSPMVQRDLHDVATMIAKGAGLVSLAAPMVIPAA